MNIAHSTTPTVACAWRPRLFALLALAVGAAVLSACSTTEGFGKDVKNLGDSIEDSAAENK
jgi:predicted small secreted protein